MPCSDPRAIRHTWPTCRACPNDRSGSCSTSSSLIWSAFRSGPIIVTAPWRWPAGKTGATRLHSDPGGAAMPPIRLRPSWTQHPEVDLIVAGEGEETLLELIAALHRHRPLTEVAGLVLRDAGSISRTRPEDQDQATSTASLIPAVTCMKRSGLTSTCNPSSSAPPGAARRPAGSAPHPPSGAEPYAPGRRHRWWMNSCSSAISSAPLPLAA